MNTYIPDSSRTVRYTSTDLSDRTISRPIHLMQYDVKIPILAVALYDEGEQYTLPTTITNINIRLGKPDGTFAFNPALGISSDRHTIYFEITQQMTLVPGSAIATVEISIDSEVVQTGYVYIKIDKNPVQQSTIESTNEFKSMKEYTDIAKDAAEHSEKASEISINSANNAATSASNAKTSETNAKTSETNAKTSETNAKTSETNAANSASNAATSASNAKTSETNAKTSETNAANSASNAATSASNAKTSETNAKTSETNAKTSETKAKTSETNAANSASNAKTSETNAKTSETNAKTSETNAANSASNAKTSETNAKTSETKAKTSETNAKTSETNAANSSTLSRSYAKGDTNTREGEKTDNAYYYMMQAKEAKTNAKESETNAANSASNAATSASKAKTSETNAANSASNAKTSEESALNSANTAKLYADSSTLSRSYAKGDTNTREGEKTDNAYYYKNQAKEYSETWKGSLLPQGEIPFANIPVSGMVKGHMYCIINSFETDSRFEEGSDFFYPAGTCVYWTENNQWKCLSGVLSRDITQAEYDALSYEEKMNGTIYWIKDGDNSIGSASQSTDGLMSSNDKKKLDSVQTGAEVNQNAFSNITVGTAIISADSKTDNLTLLGNNVTLIPDNTNDKITIGITKDNVTSALGYIPYTPTEVDTAINNLSSDTNESISNEISRATEAENNLESKKLDKITVASDNTLGLVKSGTDITVDTSGNVSVNDNSHKHTVSNISDLTATASELNVLDGITATTAELNYVDGVTSNIQMQLNSKAPLASPVLTGTPTAPTASSSTNTTQIATTAFTQTAVSNHNSSTTAHSDIRDLISGLTARLNALADSDDTTLDQLSEIVAYIKSNRTLIENVTTNKVNVADVVDNLTSTATNKPLSAKQGKVLNDLISTLTNTVNANKTKLDSIATGAEVNQNAFSNVVVGSTTISADSKTDSLTLAGSNVTITPDADNDKVTIGITKSNVTSALGYTPPTTNTTYGVATSSALGLVKSGTDITVDSSGNVSVNDDSHNHVISNVDGLQSALDGKASSRHTHTKSEVGLGNVDDTADASKNVKSSKKLQTYKQGSTTETYGDNYPIYAQWRDSTHVKMKCDNYTVETDYATTAGSASSASKATQDESGNNIKSSYASSISISDHTITLKNKNGASLGTVTVPDNNTWRGIQNNLTSDSTTDSLSAAQGKVLKRLVDGKANASHGTHVPLVCTTITDWNSATSNGWYMASNASNQPVSNGGWFYGVTIVHNSNYIRQIAWHFATDNSVSGTNCDKYERVKNNGTWGSWVNTSVRVAVPSNAKFTDTTYSAATTSSAGLMSASDKKKLDGITSGANVKFVSITQAEYNKLSTPETNVMYFITDAE